METNDALGLSGWLPSINLCGFFYYDSPASLAVLPTIGAGKH
jgi:hypothetical protein